MADSSLYDLAGAVLGAIEDGYIGNPNTLPARRYVSDGIVAWDFDSLGPEILFGSQLTVRVGRWFTHAGVLAAEVAGMPGQIIGLGCQVEVELLRCTPTVALDDRGITIPSADEIEASAAVILSDAMDVWAAIVAGVRAGLLPGCSGVAFLGWDGVGPEGGLAGGTTTVRLDLSA